MLLILLTGPLKIWSVLARVIAALDCQLPAEIQELKAVSKSSDDSHMLEAPFTYQEVLFS